MVSDYRQTDATGTNTTRRRFLGTAGTLGAAAVAGCAGGDGATPTASGGGDSYEVTMAPVGTVELEAVPDAWETYFPGYAEMGVALGQADGLNAIGNAGRFHTSHFEELDGVSVDTSDVTELVSKSGIDKELYLGMDNDVHLTDPRWLTENGFFGLSESDVDQIERTVAPFVGNAVFRRTDAWHDYRYYTMYEAFGKVAEIFQEGERYRAFREFHDSFIAEVQASLPPARERPSGLLAFAASDNPESFSPYRISGKGTNKKQFHDLGIGDALTGTGIQGLSESNRGKIDYETMLKVDPEYLFLRGHESKSAGEFEDTVLAFMREHPVASDLTAVQNGDVYRGGPIYQGPLYNLFLVERLATTVYPDTYSGELFDRDEVAGIVTGGD